MNFEDDEEWDLELLVKLVQTEEQAIAARRGVSATPLPSSSANHPCLSQSVSRDLPLRPSNPASCHSPAFDLQQRLLQAEQELSNLRQKSQQSTAVATSSIEEELQRLQAEVLFKDQEILEAKRACAEKSEQLKRVRNENEELKKHFEDVKKAKSQESLDVKTRERDAKKGAQRPSKDVQAQSKINDREGHLSALDFDTRINNGCVSSNEREINNGSKKSQQQETLLMATSQGIAQCRGQSIEKAANYNSWRHLFLINLLNIWCPRNLKEEGKELVTKLLAACEADMNILLSMTNGGIDFTKQVTDSRSSLDPSPNNCKKSFSKLLSDNVDARSVGFKTDSFPSILVKVANGLVSSWSLFLALLELSELENVRVSESAFRVLHCLLIQDEGCHKNLFKRKIMTPQPEKELFKAAGPPYFSQEKVSQPFKRLNSDSSPTNVFKRYFFSPRISWTNKDFPQCQHDGQGVPLQENVGPQIMEEMFEKKSDEVAQPGSSNHCAILMRIFKGALDKAIKGCHEPIGIAAGSMLVTIVINTEPFSAREFFGFILFDGSLASLLKMSAILEVRLQAVRLFHSLVHCPSVLRKLLDFQEQANQEQAAPFPNQSSELMQEMEIEGRSAEDNVFLQNNEDVSPQSENARALCSTDQKGSLKALEGLIYCLSPTGYGSQTFSLRRNTLRVLTFIATSDERGAAFLLAKEFVLIRAGERLKENGHSSSIPRGSLPVHLIVLLDRELNMEEEEGRSSVTTEQTDERDYVIRDTVALLCRLASHSTHSSKTVAVLTCDKNTARLSISVINRLMSRDTPAIPATEDTSLASPVNVIELYKGLRRRILASVSNL